MMNKKSNGTGNRLTSFVLLDNINDWGRSGLTKEELFPGIVEEDYRINGGTFNQDHSPLYDIPFAVLEDYPAGEKSDPLQRLLMIESGKPDPLGLKKVVCVSFL